MVNARRRLGAQNREIISGRIARLVLRAGCVATPARMRVAAPVAQWIEYWPPKPRAAGSIPAGRTTRYTAPRRSKTPTERLAFCFRAPQRRSGRLPRHRAWSRRQAVQAHGRHVQVHRRHVQARRRDRPVDAAVAPAHDRVAAAHRSLVRTHPRVVPPHAGMAPVQADRVPAQPKRLPPHCGHVPRKNGVVLAQDGVACAQCGHIRPLCSVNSGRGVSTFRGICKSGSVSNNEISKPREISCNPN